MSDRERSRIESMLRDIARRIGPGCTAEWAKTEIEGVANLLRSWNRPGANPANPADSTAGR